MTQRTQSYTQAEVLDLLKKGQGEMTQRQYAAEIGVAQQYLCDVLRERRTPGPAILRFLGLTVAFVRVERAA